MAACGVMATSAPVRSGLPRAVVRPVGPGAARLTLAAAPTATLSAAASFPRRRTAAEARRAGPVVCMGATAQEEAGERDSSAGATSTRPVTGEVEVRVYDIDRYGLSPIASKALRKEVDGIYHVAISVYGIEYWYDHQINQVDLAEVEFCHGFGPCNTYQLGETTMPREEFEEWLYSEIKDEYVIEKYDCFNHNCHHFANELALKLTDGREGIPQWCIDHGEKGLEMLPKDRAELIKNVSNKIARIMMLSWGRYNQQRFTNSPKSNGS